MQHAKLSVISWIAMALATATAVALERPEPAALTVHALKGGVYWVSGGVSNTGFIVGNSGVVVIDPQMSTDAAQKVLAEIAKITPKPVRNLVVSHSDPDHVGGIPGYPAGTNIITHENTRAVIQASAVDPSGGPALNAVYQKLLPYLPTLTLSHSESMVLDGVRMQLIYCLPAGAEGRVCRRPAGQHGPVSGDPHRRLIAGLDRSHEDHARARCRHLRCGPWIGHDQGRGARTPACQ
jgi:hypothetical protein